jgi:hypothetical protein
MLRKRGDENIFNVLMVRREGEGTRFQGWALGE